MFIPYAAQVVGRIMAQRSLAPGARVVEMGNQTYSIDTETMQNVIAELKAAGVAADFDRLKELSSMPPGDFPADPRAPFIGDFFKALGFSSYTAIDLNTRFGSLVMDLNKDLREVYGFTEQYDLVTNIGVGEHLFDQATFFKNAHQLCKPNGLMLHMLPSVMYVNHGFYNFQPVLFIDLAHANGYELLGLALTDRQGEVLDLMHYNEIGAHFSHYLPLLSTRAYGNLFVLALMRKRDERPFEYPLQGKYLIDIEGDELKHRYESTTGRPPVSRKGLFDPQPLSGATRMRVALKRRALRTLTRASGYILKHW